LRGKHFFREATCRDRDSYDSGRIESVSSGRSQRKAVYLILLVGAALFACTRGPVRPEAPAFQLRLTQPFPYPSDERAPLTNVRQIYAAPNNEIIASDVRTQAVLQYDAEGAFSALIGREGDGPGEFRSVSRLGMLGDTVWVIDFRLNRITLLDRQGRVLEVVSPSERLDVSDAQGSPTPLAIYPDRAILYAYLTTNSRLRLVRHKENSTTLLVDLNASNRWWSVPFPDGTQASSSIVQPLGTYALYSARLATNDLVVVRRPNPEAGVARYTVELFSPDGVVTRSASVRFDLRPITESDIEEALAKFPSGLASNFVSSGRFASAVAFDRAARSSLIIPSLLHPIPNDRGTGDDAAVLPTQNGDVWIRLRSSRSGPTLTSWDVIRADGTRGLATVDAEFKLLEVRRGMAWGTVRDSLGVPTIVRYSIEESIR
jgi:hypothetical protein